MCEGRWEKNKKSTTEQPMIKGNQNKQVENKKIKRKQSGNFERSFVFAVCLFDGKIGGGGGI